MCNVSINTTVKGGLPVVVTCDMVWDDFFNAYCAEDMQVFWTSGKPVTDTVHDSIPQGDFDRISEELYQAYCW